MVCGKRRNREGEKVRRKMWKGRKLETREGKCRREMAGWGERNDF